MIPTNTENSHQDLIGFIWTIADKLRGPYRPPQYRRVMLPLIVLGRLDAVLEPTKQDVLDAKAKYEAMGLQGEAFEKAIAKVAIGSDRQQFLYNTSKFTFQELLNDADGIASNLINYINGFSPRARDIFEKFNFESEIQKLDESNRLYLIIKDFCKPEVDLSPAQLSNLQMGYLFEELVRKFNEQANEEAGDHFTPREVIRLMVNLVFCEETDVFQQGIYRSVYDPTLGTGGMLSVSEEHIKKQNPEANLGLFGQEYNIEKLDEKRTALISHAVTKGLDPRVPMKDSGIEWLGKIPNHWEVIKVKHLTKILRGKFTHRPRNDPRFYDGQYPFIQTGDVANANKFIMEYTQTLNENGYAVSKEFPSGTLVMTIAANIGDMAILNFNACFPDSIVGFLPSKMTDIFFLYHLFSSMKKQFFRTYAITLCNPLSFVSFSLGASLSLWEKGRRYANVVRFFMILRKSCFYQLLF
ncbi:type I restriction-modification system subunit M N-terminal domain-containing protein [Nodularia spumigena]|nr:type I restriction-modification system subunit M N-terminal domain-containing protein [Nodularia spumigena]MEA5612932.1 type I restriction-modification system subunit M N-terminal domain-containing protein [Nodularia spumigena UHCC 0040]